MQTSTSDSALARLNPNGSLDTSFDGDGKIRVALSNYFDTATSIAIQADGKILTSGSVMSSTNNDLGTLDNNFALVRYNSNGSFDNTYGTNGKAIRTYLSMIWQTISLLIRVAEPLSRAKPMGNLQSPDFSAVLRCPTMPDLIMMATVKQTFRFSVRVAANGGFRGLPMVAIRLFNLVQARIKSFRRFYR